MGQCKMKTLDCRLRTGGKMQTANWGKTESSYRLDHCELTVNWVTEACRFSPYLHDSTIYTQNVCCLLFTLTSCLTTVLHLYAVQGSYSYTALRQYVQFVKDRFGLLECSPASGIAPQNDCEEKRRPKIYSTQN